MNEYRVVTKKTLNSGSIIFDNLTHSEMLEKYAEYKNDFSLKIYVKEENRFWEIESIYENGKMVSFKDIRRELKTEKVKPYGYPETTFEEVFTQISTAAPSRKENIGSLLFDYIKGEEISKPKLTVLKSNKE